jgi:predicted Zn-dependent protease
MPDRCRTCRGLALSATFAAAAALAACAVNPVTGDREFSLMSEQQEIAIGQEMDGQIGTEMGVYDDRDLQAYVHDVGQRLAQVSERPHLPWKFTVVDSPAINAFALPGGYIYLTRGIMPFLGDETEMAGVLGHEIGHVTARHSAQQYSRATGAQLGLVLGGIFVPAIRPFGGLAETGLGLLFLRYGRDDELQADALGVRYTARSGWDPAGVAGMLGTLDRIADESADRRGVPNWLSTHPAPADRVRQVQSAIDQARAESTVSRGADREDYLRRIDGLIYGDNPDQGILRGHEFLHAALRFALDFPKGWQVVNSASQVVGRAPDADVFLLLQLVERPAGRNIEQVALSTMEEAGFTAVNGDRTSINRLEAFLGTYDGTIQELGRVRVRAAHIVHGQRVYMVAGLAPAQLFARAERDLTAGVRSFRALTAAQAEAIRPDRIDLYTARAGDTWESLVERYAPGAITPATLAIMNGASSREQPRAGQRLKIVVAG